MFLIRLIFLPFKLAFALMGLTLRIGYRVGKTPFKVTGRALGIFRVRAWLLFAIGFGVGLLLAPGPGRELRAKLRQRLDGATLTDEGLADKVSFELAHAPRTWHLPQPSVQVNGGRVTLSGSVKQTVDADELARVSAAVADVTGVDNQLTIVDS